VIKPDGSPLTTICDALRSDYAVLVRFVHADPEAKTGYPSVTRTCFGHVARGLLTEAGDLLYSNDD